MKARLDAYFWDDIVIFEVLEVAINVGLIFTKISLLSIIMLILYYNVVAKDNVSNFDLLKDVYQESSAPKVLQSYPSQQTDINLQQIPSLEPFIALMKEDKTEVDRVPPSLLSQRIPVKVSLPANIEISMLDMDIGKIPRLVSPVADGLHSQKFHGIPPSIDLELTQQTPIDAIEIGDVYFKFEEVLSSKNVNEKDKDSGAEFLDE